jgi:hypothetical protein
VVLCGGVLPSHHDQLSLVSLSPSPLPFHSHHYRHHRQHTGHSLSILRSDFFTRRDGRTSTVPLSCVIIPPSPPSHCPLKCQNRRCAARKRAVRTSSKSAKNHGVSLGETLKMPPRSKVPALTAAGVGGLVPCAVCGRTFAMDRIAVHQKICRKNSAGVKKRGEFDTSKQRTNELNSDGGGFGGGFGAPPPRRNPRGSKSKLHKKSSATPPAAAPSTKGPKGIPKWKQQHMEFQRMVRGGGGANGGGVQERSAAAPSYTDSNMVPCPHCNRTFSDSAAERHIPKCKNIINRPKNPTGSGSSSYTVSRISNGRAPSRERDKGGRSGLHNSATQGMHNYVYICIYACMYLCVYV